MIRWISISALIIGVCAILLFWFESRNLRERIIIIESQINEAKSEINVNTEKLTRLSGSVDKISKHTGKLIAEKQSQEAEKETLIKSPSEFIHVLGENTTEKGIFTIQTRINKVQLGNKSRFNVHNIQISVTYVENDGIETGVTSTIKVNDLLVAGQTKWFEVDAQWIGGRPSAKLTVTRVEVVEK